MTKVAEVPISMDFAYNDRHLSKPIGIVLNSQWKLTDVTLVSPHSNTVGSLKIWSGAYNKRMQITGSIAIYSSNEYKCLTRKNFSEVLDPGNVSIQVSFPEYTVASSNGGNVKFHGHMVIFEFSGVQDNSTNKLYKNEGDFATSKYLSQLSTQLASLMNNQSCLFSDVNLKCGKVVIPAHKNILSVRSPVFDAMFRNDMKEKQESYVKIDDIKPPILQAMLTFIYTAKTEELDESSAGPLLFAADKYQLEDLKEICCDYLKSVMSIKNVLHILVLGDLHDEDLKKSALQYICKCVKFSVLEQEKEWKSLQETNKDLAMEALTSVVKSLQEYKDATSNKSTAAKNTTCRSCGSFVNMQNQLSRIRCSFCGGYQ